MDQDTFLTTLYVMIDDFCQSQGYDEKHRPGPAASLSCSEVVTLAVFGQWGQFPSERAYYRYALSHLRAAFPTMPIVSNSIGCNVSSAMSSWPLVCSWWTR